VEYAVEYRDVRDVDGKPVKKRSERALDVINRAISAESLKRELEVIDRENQRYDLNFRVNDATVNQGGLGPKFRADYLADFDRTGGTKQKPSLTRAALLTFTYGAFRRFEVATEETIAAPGSPKDP